MELVGVSGTVLWLFQIRDYTLRSKVYAEKSSTKIHGVLSEVYGEFTVDFSTVSHWANIFHCGCVSIDNRGGFCKVL